MSCTRLHTFEKKRENDRKDRVWRQTRVSAMIHVTEEMLGGFALLQIFFLTHTRNLRNERYTYKKHTSIFGYFMPFIYNNGMNSITKTCLFKYTEKFTTKK